LFLLGRSESSTPHLFAAAVRATASSSSFAFVGSTTGRGGGGAATTTSGGGTRRRSGRAWSSPSLPSSFGSPAASTRIWSVVPESDQRQEERQQQQQQKKKKALPLIPFEDVLGDDDDGGEEDGNDNYLGPSGFYDIDYDDDDVGSVGLLYADDDGYYYGEDRQANAAASEREGEFAGFAREEADILDERESRMYAATAGKAERCVLVGVEDRSELRRNKQRNNGKKKAGKGDLYSPYYESADRSEPVDDRGDVFAGDDDDDDEGDAAFTLDESLVEMRELIKTAGMDIAGEITQRLNEVNPRTYVNTGKVAEAAELLKELDCSTIVFDAELTPGQQKSLENAFNKNLLQNDFLVQEREVKVIDRTALILDIFAQHARTREGKLQVDLALHEYRKPRLTRMWTHLERQSGAGGVGLRGPGESQLEIDKRLVRDRIITLKQKINDVQKQRTMRRRGRERMGLPILSLVGYTNAGKSSLLNSLTRAGVMAESMLFATLDPTTRKVKLPGLKTHPEVLLTDTVGFIQKLPTHLVAAFRATLEEVQEADLLIHVIDVSNPSWRKQERAVSSVLTDIGASDKPIVRVWNKIDLLDPADAEYLRYEAAMSSHTVAVSALNGDGMSDMVACVEDALAELLVPIEVLIPYSKGDELNNVHEQGNVEMVDYREEGVLVRARVPESVANRLDQYGVDLSCADDTSNAPIGGIEGDRTDGDDEIDWVALGRGRHKKRDG